MLTLIYQRETPRCVQIPSVLSTLYYVCHFLKVSETQKSNRSVCKKTRVHQCSLEWQIKTTMHCF